jgi:plastocyanin
MRYTRVLRRSLLAGSLAVAAIALPAGGSSSAAAPLQVIVCGDVSPHPIDLQNFYPSDAIVHVGDSVAFTFRGFHTVTFVPVGSPVPGPIIPASGVYPAHTDEAHAPFWWSNAVPRLQFNSAAVFPSPTNAVDGSTFVSSGLPQGPAPYVATFPKAGRYEYHCLIHAFMHGFITVVPKGTPIPSPAQQAALGVQQRAADVKAALALEAKSAAGVTANHIMVGNGTHSFSLLEFFVPKTVHVGDLVTMSWSGTNEVHTATFGDDTYVTNLENTLIPPPPPPMILNPVGALPSDPPGTVITLTPATHGNGFLNSGVVTDPPIPSPLPHTFQVRFGAPGVYHFGCLIHTFMEADITVVP